MNYTAIGDAVNLGNAAGRIEQTIRHLDHRQRTHCGSGAGDGFEFRLLDDDGRWRGKSKAVKIYELLSRSAAKPLPGANGAIAAYEEGI